MASSVFDDRRNSKQIDRPKIRRRETNPPAAAVHRRYGQFTRTKEKKQVFLFRQKRPRSGECRCRRKETKKLFEKCHLKFRRGPRRRNEYFSLFRINDYRAYVKNRFFSFSRVKNFFKEKVLKECAQQIYSPKSYSFCNHSLERWQTPPNKRRHRHFFAVCHGRRRRRKRRSREGKFFFSNFKRPIIYRVDSRRTPEAKLRNQAERFFRFFARTHTVAYASS